MGKILDNVTMHRLCPGSLRGLVPPVDTRDELPNTRTATGKKVMVGLSRPFELDCPALEGAERQPT